MAKKVTVANFEEEVVKSEIPVLIDFYATWCEPCKRLEPQIEELAKELDGRVKILKLDVDESRELAMKYRIMSVPTMLFFKEGMQVHMEQGPKTKDYLMNKVNEYL